MSSPSALVAEDSQLGGWAVSHALRGVGFDVRRAATWVEVLGWLRMQPFRTVVLSASLDPAGVAAMVGHIATHHEGTAVIVLADADEAWGLGRKCGSKAVIVSKPLDLDRLVRIASAYVIDEPVALSA
jgi:DNA-binding NtrC family response regulator